LDGEGPGTKGRITAMTVAEGLDRKKIEALLKVSFLLICFVWFVLAVRRSCSVVADRRPVWWAAGTKGRITAMTVAEGLDRKKIEALLKVRGQLLCAVFPVFVTCFVYFLVECCNAQGDAWIARTGDGCCVVQVRQTCLSCFLQAK
jgi:hypothetical protein